MVPINEEIEYKNPMASSVEEIHQRDREEVLKKMLNALNPDQRACLVLRSSEGLSYQGIAEVLHVNINTVRTRIKRARETLLDLRKKAVSHEL